MQSYHLFDPRVRKGRFWPTVEACYSQTWNQYKMAPHIHERAEIMYVLKGKCFVHLLNYTQDPASGEISVLDKRTEQLGVGDFILLDRGVLHALEVPDTSYMVNAEFAVRNDETAMLSLEQLCASSDTFRRLLELHCSFVRGVDREGKLYDTLSPIVSSFSISKISDDEKAMHDLRLAQMLLSMAQEIKMASLGINSVTYVRQTVQLLNEWMQEDIKVTDLADAIGIAPSYLQRLFKQVNGVSIIDYLNNLRIERSKCLLVHTQEPIVDVAVAVGYNSRQHFCRIFTQKTGMSPQKYRQMNKNYENRQLYHFEQVSDLFVHNEGSEDAAKR